MNIIPIPGFSEPVSSLTHLFSAFTILVLSSPLLSKGKGNLTRFVGLVIYTVCAIFLFSMSGVYHLLEKGTDASYVLRILDHNGIYLLIAGTFTPLHIILMRGIKRWLTLFIIWVLGITGLTLTSIFFSKMPEWMFLTFYLAMGWMAIFTVYSLYKVDKVIAKFVIWGGIAYTIGASLDFFKWPTLIPGIVGPHELFHLFVMLGAGYHWLAIFKIADIPISMNLKFIINKYIPTHLVVTGKNEKLSFTASSEDEIKEVVREWAINSYPKDLHPKSVEYEFISINHDKF